jgi:hypothetical protein
MLIPRDVPRNEKALAKAKTEAMNKLSRDYEKYCAWKRRSLDTDVHQLALNLEIDDNA